jgi:hypothetical protein
MSVKATTWAWYDSKAEGADLLVLLALADFADESGRCFGSWGTMQKKTKLARSTIARCIKRLEASGELTAIEGAKTLNGRNLATVWQLPVKGRCQNETGVSVTLPPSDSDTTPGVSVTLPPSDSDTPTQSNVLKRSLTTAPAISSPSHPISEKEAPKPKRATAPKFDPASILLPHGPGFQKWWLHFIEHRSNPIKGRRNPLTPLAAKIILGELAAVNEQQAVESIKKCIAAGWVKPFPPEPPAKATIVELPPQGRPKQTALEKHLAEQREQFAKENAA